MITFGSLFAGIGGIDLGLERAGMRCAWQVEIDDYCNKVLAKHWPDVPKYRDVRSVGAHNLASVDLIAGGFPCQDISYAGKGAGLSGERSGLWFEFARIIRELRPRYVLVENVAALLVRGMGDVLGTLASFGYDAEWQCLPAVAFGAPHRRDRVFIVAYAHGRRGGPSGPPQGQARSAGTSFDSSADVPNTESNGRGSRRAGRTLGARARQENAPIVADTDSTERRQIAQGWHVFNRDDTGRQETASGLGAFREDAGWRQWATEPAVGRVADGVPHRVDRLRGLGNAVVPQVAEFIGRCIIATEH